MFFTISHLSKLPHPLLATTEADNAPVILSGVLLSLIVIYLASKIGAEIAKRLDLPPVLGELVAGVIVGVSALRLIIFPEGGFSASDSLVFDTEFQANHSRSRPNFNPANFPQPNLAHAKTHAHLP